MVSRSTTGLTSSTLLTQGARRRGGACGVREEVSHLRRRLAEEDTTPPPPLLLGAAAAPRQLGVERGVVVDAHVAHVRARRCAAGPAVGGRALRAVGHADARVLGPGGARGGGAARRRGGAAAGGVAAARRGGGTRARRLHAVVGGSVQLRGDGVRAMPAYVITVVRGCCWEVQPASPTGSPSTAASASSASARCRRRPRGCPSAATPSRHREYSLNRYLQAALPAAEPSPRGRALLLRFLCRSHMHWLYEPDARAARCRACATSPPAPRRAPTCATPARPAAPPARSSAAARAARQGPWQQAAPAAPPDMFGGEVQFSCAPRARFRIPLAVPAVARTGQQLAVRARRLCCCAARRDGVAAQLDARASRPRPQPRAHVAGGRPLRVARARSATRATSRGCSACSTASSSRR